MVLRDKPWGLIILTVLVCICIPAYIYVHIADAQSNLGPGTFIYCGTTVACAGTQQSNGKIVTGSAPLSSGTPSTAVITGLSFTSSTSYKCIAADTTTIASAVVAVTYTSGTSFTINGPTTVTDTVEYICAGN